MQAEGDVDGADVGHGFQVGDVGALEVGGGGGLSHVYPADGLLGVDEIHGHGLLGGDGGQPGRRVAQGGGADVVEVRDEQHGKAVHRFWGGRSHGGRNKPKQRIK